MPEHLVVALYSHAFLLLSLLALFVLAGIGGATSAPWVAVAVGIARTAVLAWMPLYLFVMQKRVYGGHWLPVLLRYLVLGAVYVVLVSLAAAYAALAGISRWSVPVYEVNVEHDAGIADAYRAWLDAHVREILALPGFTGASVMEVVDPAPAPGSVALCVRCRLRDAAALEAYLRDHAPRLRADGVARFGDRFRAWRRILHPLGDD